MLDASRPGWVPAVLIAFGIAMALLLLRELRQNGGRRRGRDGSGRDR